MRNLASFLIAAAVSLSAPAALAQNTMEKNGMAADSMSKEPPMSPAAKPKGKKKDRMHKDAMGKDSMSKDSMQSPGAKPRPM